MRKRYLNISNAVNDLLACINNNTTAVTKTIDVGIEVALVKGSANTHTLTRNYGCKWLVEVTCYGATFATFGYNNEGNLVCCIDNNGYNNLCVSHYINCALTGANLPYYTQVNNGQMQLLNEHGVIVKQLTTYVIVN